MYCGLVFYTATAPKEPVLQKEQKSSEGGLKKNRRKARLIIRNLSFKV